MATTRENLLKSQKLRRRKKSERKEALWISVFLLANHVIIPVVIFVSEHVPVMLAEAIEYLNIKADGIYVDMTLGGGGHSEAILKRLDQGRLFAFDQDRYAIERAKKRLGKYTNIIYIHDNFRSLRHHLTNNGVDKVDGILFDLGVSSFQFDIPERGFSYQHDGPLDMRMDENNTLDAFMIVNQYTERELAEILFRYGEEPFSRPIARKIVQARSASPIKTTLQLVEVIKSALPERILRKKGHPAKQTFQALRIAVNDELNVLQETLIEAIDLLEKGGRLVTITFHSLEDRIVKTIFKEKSTVSIPKGLPVIVQETPPLNLLTKRVIKPSEAEILANNRAHSAKLRAVEKAD